MLDPKELEVGARRYQNQGDWLGLGSVLGGVYIQLSTLEVIDSIEFFSRYTQFNIKTAYGPKFKPFEVSPSGEFVILKGRLTDPLLLARNSIPSGAAYPVVGDHPLSTLDSAGTEFKFSSEERFLALKAMTHINFIEVRSGKIVGRFPEASRPQFNLDMAKNVAWSEDLTATLVDHGQSARFLEMDWLNDHTALIMTYEERSIHFFQLDVLTGELKSLFSIKDSESFIGKVFFKYLPKAKKLALVSNLKYGSEVYLLNPLTGDGESRLIHDKLKGLYNSPDGKTFVTWSTSNGFIFNTQNLAEWGPLFAEDLLKNRLSLLVYNHASEIIAVREGGEVDLLKIDLK